MDFSVGEITARCHHCDGTQFDPVSVETAGAHSQFRCASCGKRTTYSALIVQIGEEAVKRSKRLLGSLSGKKTP
jgi:hypothetical protein